MAILFYLWTRRCDPGGFRDVRPLVDPRPPGGLGHPVHTFQSRDSRLSTGAVRDWRAVARVHRWNLYREHLYDAHVGLILVGPANRRQHPVPEPLVRVGLREDDTVAFDGVANSRCVIGPPAPRQDHRVSPAPWVDLHYDITEGCEVEFPWSEEPESTAVKEFGAEVPMPISPFEAACLFRRRQPLLNPTQGLNPTQDPANAV